MRARITFKHFDKVFKEDEGLYTDEVVGQTAVFDIEILKEDQWLTQTVLAGSFDKGGHYPPLRLSVDENFNLAAVKRLATDFAASVHHGVGEQDVLVVGMPEEA